MTGVVIIGAQWGDEGKGKIVDWLSEKADIVVRFQGGHNAGHTLVIDNVVHKLSLLPSGIVRKGKISLLGNGVVIDPLALIKEIEDARSRGIVITPDNFYIAENACLILSVHQQNDIISEQNRGMHKIGTTGRGIGPAYEDIVGRRAVRMCDLADPAILKERVDALVMHHNAFRKGLGHPLVEARVLLNELQEIAPILLPYMRPVWRELRDFHAAKKRILGEGAQGFWLDVSHGTYPYVTSSSTLPGQIYQGAGMGVGTMDYVLGIAKAYTTRVGSGPFPTEEHGPVGEYLGHKGKEFGTVTNRKRRCGWFDAVMVRQAVQIAGISGIALTKLDVLDGIETIKICVAYDYQGTRYDYLCSSMEIQANLTPIYEEHPGWKGTTHKMRNFHDLPPEAVSYVKRLEALIGVPITVISTSPEREDTITLQDPFYLAEKE